MSSVTVPFSLALSARAPVPVDIRILHVVRMSLRAMCFLRLKFGDDVPPPPAPNVLRVGYGLQVIGVHARRCATEVVYFQSSRYRTYEVLVRPYVRAAVPAAPSEHTVSEASLPSCPVPTESGRLDPRPESFFIRRRGSVVGGPGTSDTEVVLSAEALCVRDSDATINNTPRHACDAFRSSAKRVAVFSPPVVVVTTPSTRDNRLHTLIYGACTL